MRLSMVGQVFRWRWRLLAVLAAGGAVLGVCASLVFSPGYETSTSVLLQGPREPDELLTEAQVAMSTVVLDRAAAALRLDTSGTELQDSVLAEVADGNVIEITATADSPEGAQQLADQVADEYVTFSSQITGNPTDASGQLQQEQQEALREQIVLTNERITQLHSSASQGVTVESVQVRTELEALRSSLAEAVTTLDEAEAAASRTNMVVMGPADRPTGAAAPTMLHFVAGGTLLFLVLGVLGHLVAARTDRRVRGEEEIGAALGAPVLAGLDVPATPQATVELTGWRKVLRWLVPDDRPWHVPEPALADDTGRDIRYRRVLTRLRSTPPPVLVVVPQDDPTAQSAAARLTALAGTDGPRLRVVEVSPTRPTVPDREGGASAAVVIVTPGTRTAWELVAITEACADAGRQVLGTVIAHRTVPRTPVTTQPDKDPAMAGST